MYDLTPWGRELEPVLMALGRWGVRSPALPAAPASPAALVVALRTMFDPAAAGRSRAEVALHVVSPLGKERLRARVVGGRLELERGPAENPAVTLQSDPETFKGLAFSGLQLSAAQETGALTLTGDPEQAERFFGLFRLPEPVAT